MFTPIVIVTASFATVCGVGGYLLWRWVTRVQQRWQSAQARGRAAGAESQNDDSLSSDIEELQFRSDLAEVQLLLDFISGRPDKAFAWRADPKAPDGARPAPSGADPASSSTAALAQAIASDRITLEELKQIATIRFPPNKTFEANAADAALLIAVRDKLNQLVHPASGLTIAFTLRTWAPWRISSKYRGREWARWKLAAAAHPHLGYAAAGFRLKAFAFSALALLVTFSAVWISNEVADGTAKLKRLQDLDQKWSAMVEVIRQVDGSEAAPNAEGAPNAIDLSKGATIKRVVRYCDKRKLIQPVKDASGHGLVEQFDSVRQYEICDNHDRLTSQILAADHDLTQWRIHWRNSPVFVIHCGMEQWLGGNSAECTKDSRRFREQMPVVTAALETPLLLASLAPEGADKQTALPLSNDVANDIADVLANLSNIWLPMLYGFSGAIVAALRTIYRKISASTLAPWDTRLLGTRMVLGVMAGSCVGLFFSTSGTGLQGNVAIGTLSLSAIAFLAGYAVDGLFGMVDEIVHRVFQLDKEGPQTAK